jgi:hypothetical protein
MAGKGVRFCEGTLPKSLSGICFSDNVQLAIEASCRRTYSLESSLVMLSVLPLSFLVTVPRVPSSMSMQYNWHTLLIWYSSLSLSPVLYHFHLCSVSCA